MLYETWDCWSRDMLNFKFLKESLWLVSSPHFVHDFSGKISLMLNYINFSTFIILLPLLLEISSNMCITIVCYPNCDVIDFEICLTLFIKPFFHITKNSAQKFKYVKNKKGFQTETKNIFNCFNSLYVITLPFLSSLWL